MKQILNAASTVVLCVALGVGAAAGQPHPTAPQKDSSKMTKATGTFEVKLTPQSLSDAAADPTLARLSIDKQFHGDLEGTSKGEMLSARTAVEASAGYVAIERVTGSLHGRKGTFVLQHSATMNRGEPRLSIVVVPDSGTGELAGLAGTMNIKIAEGRHSYEFEHSLK